MSTTILYHAFGIRGYSHVRLRNCGGVMHWRIERGLDKLRCAACQSTDVIRREGKIRSFQALPVGPTKGAPRTLRPPPRMQNLPHAGPGES